MPTSVSLFINNSYSSPSQVKLIYPYIICIGINTLVDTASPATPASPPPQQSTNSPMATNSSPSPPPGISSSQPEPNINVERQGGSNIDANKTGGGGGKQDGVIVAVVIVVLLLIGAGIIVVVVVLVVCLRKRDDSSSSTCFKSRGNGLFRGIGEWQVNYTYMSALLTLISTTIF